MFIRLFIRITDHNKALEIAKNVASNIPSELIKNISFKVEPYWKFDDTSVAEIRLDTFKELGGNVKNEFLNSISNNWMFFGYDKSECISSKTMEGGCAMNYDLDMIDVHF